MIAGLVAVFFYQVAYGVESGGYPIAGYDKYDRMIITYQTGFQTGKQDGLNAVADIGDTCNDGRTPAANDTECTQGYIDGYNTACHIGVVKFGTEDAKSSELELQGLKGTSATIRPYACFHSIESLHNNVR